MQRKFWLKWLWSLLLVGLLTMLAECQQGAGGGNGAALGDPDFSLVLSKARVELPFGTGQEEVLVQVVAKNGFNGAVSLSLEGVPQGLEVAFNANSVTPQSTQVVTGIGATTLVLGRGSAPSGEYTVKVVGVSGALRREATLHLSIPSSLVPNRVYDFSQGIPSDWTVLDHTGNGGWTTVDECNRNSDYGPLDPIVPPFAIIDSDCLGEVDVDTELRTPPLNLSGYATVRLKFDHYFYFNENEIGDVDVSTDGGNTWINVARFQGEDVGPETHTVDISNIAAGQPNVIIRFRYYDANYDWFWIVDNILIEAQ